MNGKRPMGASSICLLKDDNGVVTSNYGFTYDNLADILDSGEYADCIKDGDWIELSTPDGGTYKMYANVDTYYGEGEEGKEIGHHIDFISDNLIYGSYASNNGSTFTSTDINSWRMNYSTTSYSSYGNNNGVATEESPFLANSTEHRGANGGIIDKLNAYYSANICEGLKSYIVKKYHKVPTRYKSGTILSDEYGSKWADMPYLWIPYEWEVWGKRQSGTQSGYEKHMKQYYSFSSISNFRIKYDKLYSTSKAVPWWTATATNAKYDSFCCINGSGTAYSTYSREYQVGAPLCFRFMNTKYNEGERPSVSPNICLLKDDNGVVTSDYGFTYDKLSEVLNSGNYEGYIKDGDWIELSTPDGGTYKMYANIDTYYGEGEDDEHKIGHHIDFISEELIYGSTSVTNGSDNYSSTNINSWRMNKDTTYSSFGSNNGVATETSPFLANSTEHRGAEGGIIDKLNAYYSANISETLKTHIVKKYHKVPTRYQSGTGLTDDNGSKWADMPYLWIPYEKEVWGSRKYATNGYESNMKQYHSFSSNSNFKVKADKKGTSTSWNWWTASAYSGNSYFCCYVNSSGSATNYRAYSWNYGAPLCFRFQ